MNELTKKIKTGIIGYGYAGRIIHQQLIQMTRGLELYAVVTNNPERKAYAIKCGLKVYPDVSQFLENPDIELVVIATPHDTHAEFAIKTLKSGKHVVTDKIMCLTAREADAMIEAAYKNNKMLSVFHNRRWDEDFLTVHQYIRDSRLGKPEIVKSYIYSDSVPIPGRWRSIREKGGGIFSDWGAHLIDQVLLINSAKVISVYCNMLYFVKDVDVETWALCVLTFEDGTRGIIETANNNHSRQKGWEIWGEKAKLIVEGFDPQEMALRNGELITTLSQNKKGCIAKLYTKDYVVEELETVPGNWIRFYENIVEHLLYGRELAVKPEEVKRVVAIREVALKSAETNKVIKVSI